tara:strand:- start:20 stop:2044 length:2025 start_codon:yes stop_codon:yes gene_type:complete
MSVDEIIDGNAEQGIDKLISEGEYFYRKGRYAESLRVFNHVISLDPSQSLAWFNRGVLLETKGDLKGAQQSFEISLDLDSSFAPAAANLAVLLDRIGDNSEATKWALNAMSTFDSHPLLKAIVDKSAGVVQKSPAKDWKEVSGWGSSKSGKAPNAAIIIPPQKGEEINFEGGPKEISSYEFDADDLNEIMEIHNLESKEQLLREATLHDRDTNLFLDRGELENAARTVKFIDSKIPKEAESISVDVVTLEAELKELIKNGDYEKAVELAKPQLKNQAEFAPIWALSGGAKAKMNDLKSAIIDLKKSIELNPFSSTANHNLGVMLKKSSKLEESLFYFEKALEIDSDYLKAANNLVNTAKELGRSDLELKGYRTLLRENSSHPNRLEFVRLLLSLAKSESSVLGTIEQPLTIKEGPSLAKEALLHLKDDMSLDESILIAEAMFFADQHVESVEQWKKLIVENPKESRIWSGLSRSLERIGEYDKSEKCKIKAEELSSTSESFENLLNPDRINQKSESDEDHNKNFVDLQSAASNLPKLSNEIHDLGDNAVEWYNKGLLLMSENKFSEAISCYDKSLTQVSEDLNLKIKIINGKGSAFYGMKMYAESINSYHEAMMLDPSSVSGLVLYNLGVSYAELKSYQDAINCFEQAIPRLSDSETISRVKSQIKICKKLHKN